MPDLFLSYSRRNADVMRLIYDAFQKQDRPYDVWVDFEDIDKTDEWWNAIDKGIVTSDNFVFVLSNDSLASPVCQLELMTALGNHKRIIPIALEVPDTKTAFDKLKIADLTGFIEKFVTEHKIDIQELGKDNWEIISGINWIFLKSDETEQLQAIQELVMVVNENPEHKQLHTRILVQSTAWLNGNRDNNLLLRGIQLEQAVDWIEAITDEFPRIMQSQIQYIVRSREVQKRNQAMYLGIAFFVLLLIGIVGIVLLFAQNQTQAANLANAQSRIVQSADSLLDAGVPYDAALISLESLQLDYSSAAERILSESLSQLYTLAVYEGHDAAVNGIAFINGDTEFLTVGGDGVLNRWMKETGELLRGIALPDSPEALNIVVSSDENFAFIGTNEGQILRVNLSDETVTEMMGTDATIAIALSNDDQFVISGHDDGRLMIWDAETGDLIEALEIGSRIRALAVSESGLAAVSITINRIHQVYIWEIASGIDAEVATLTFDDGRTILASLAFSPDSTQLALGTLNNALYLVNTSDWQPPYQVYNAGGEVKDLVYTDGGAVLYLTIRDPLNSRLNSIIALQLFDEQVLRRFSGHQNDVRALDISQDGAFLLSSSADMTARLWVTATSANLTPTEILLPEPETSIPRLRDVDLLPDGERLLVLDETDAMYLIERESQLITTIRDDLGTTLLVANPSDDSILVMGRTPDDTGIVRRYDLLNETWQTISELDITMITFTILSDGRWLFLDTSQSSLWLGDESLIQPIYEQSGIMTYSLSPDGQYLYVLHQDFPSVINRIDLSNPASTLLQIAEFDDFMDRMTRSSDGTRFLTSDLSGNVIVWRLDDISLTELNRYEFTDGTIVALAFLPETDRYAIGTGTGEVFIRNYVSQATERHIIAHSDSLVTMLFTDSLFITGGRDNTVREWSRDLSAYLDFACTRLQSVDPLRITDLPDAC